MGGPQSEGYQGDLLSPQDESWNILPFNTGLDLYKAWSSFPEFNILEDVSSILDQI